MLKAVYFSVLIQPLPHSFSHSHNASRELHARSVMVKSFSALPIAIQSQGPPSA